ncbi:MAG TPA: hypothetical protein VGR02_10495 [Thermoanaerobaculia bacterium]|nr:hypothetical protein [Thermoanaerobaculia bacterium]
MSRRFMSSFLRVPLFITLLLAGAASAQTPSADWRTLTTAHYRVHYPREYEAWAARAASRLEAVREAVVQEVGFAPDVVTEVLVANPYADPNGLTYAFLDAPRIVLYTEPPGPEEQIGEYGEWLDLLTVHEVGHQVHLARPSRNPMSHLLERALPLDPMTLGAPRWVIEGYATVIEGRVTGSGRPGGTFRAAILRKWASTGRLPTYGQLDANQSFLGMSMAYLAGSAYLEWLEARAGAGSLRKVWARMTARRRRSFDQAFEGVFGESPSRLYGVFSAELTARAVADARAGQAVEGELWQETTRGSGDPAVSPDGSQIAVVLRPFEEPARLVVWSTGANTEAEERQAKAIAKLLERDPEDVAPATGKPLPRKALRTLILPDGGNIQWPRWTADGRTIYYSHRQPDLHGELHYDLFRWVPSTGEEARVTRLADVRDADPFPDGRRAVAVRNRFGFSQLVTLDLQSGAVEELTPLSLDIVYTHPRVSRDGARIAYAAHGDGAWRIVVRDVQSGHETTLNTANAAQPEWSGDTLFATVLAHGYIDVHSFDPRSGLSGPVTRSVGGAIDPAPAPDGRLFFMSLEPDGYVVRVLPPSQAIPEARMADAKPPAIRRFEAAPAGPSKNYGIGKQEIDWLLGGAYAAHGNVTELGLRIGDAVGRLDTIVIGSIGGGYGMRGGTIASTWRGWPVDAGAQLFSAGERGTKMRGGVVRALWDAQWPLSDLTIDGAALATRLDDRSRNLAFAGAAWRQRQVRGSMRTSQQVELSGAAGSTDGIHFAELGGRASAAIRTGGFAAHASYERRGTSGGSASPYDRLSVGGLPSSITPDEALAQRVFEPAYVPFTLTGDRYEGRRVDATWSGMTFFWQQHLMRPARGVRQDDRKLAGIERTISIGPMPIINLPAADLTVGVARLLDEHRTRFWLGLRWRP